MIPFEESVKSLDKYTQGTSYELALARAKAIGQTTHIMGESGSDIFMCAIFQLHTLTEEEKESVIEMFHSSKLNHSE